MINVVVTLGMMAAFEPKVLEPAMNRLPVDFEAIFLIFFTFVLLLLVIMVIVLFRFFWIFLFWEHSVHSV